MSLIATIVAASAVAATAGLACKPGAVLGCYDDANIGPYGLLPAPQPQLHDKVTLENCAAACAAVKLPVAGVDGGNHCGCGHESDLAWNREVSSAECQATPCHGDPAEKACGGLNRTLAFNFTCGPPPPSPPPPSKRRGGQYFPGFHPRMHAAHNNDVNGPFFFNGHYHIFMQQDFPWVKGWNGAIGWGHMVSTDLAHWKEISSYTGYVDAFVPGRWHDPKYGVPAGGYYSGSVTVVHGVPHAVFPSYFNEGGPCIDPWAPGHDQNKCLMVYQYSTPTNLSDPHLANWTQPRSFVFPTQGVQPHDVTFEDPSAAWEDPSAPGEFVFIGQTNDQKGVLLEGWRSNNGSDWSQGFSSLGNFFPTTHDARCSIPTGCGYFTPSFGNGVAIRGYHLLWGGDDQYWLGTYETNHTLNASADFRLAGLQQFVPATVPQPFDGPESSCAKGFFDTASNRYLLWFWVSPGGDGEFVVPTWGWDSMISVPRVLDVDPELLQITLYPVEELALLRSLPPVVPAKTLPAMTAGMTPLTGVNSSQVDIEVMFDWSKTKSGTIPQIPNLQVGVAVLVGSDEQTTVTLTMGVASRFNNGTRRTEVATMLGVDTRKTRSDRKGNGVYTPTPVLLKPGETSLTLRVLVDRSVIDAFAMAGRGSMTRRAYPKQWDTSIGAALMYNVPDEAGLAGGPPPDPPSATITVWEMGSGYVDN